MRNKGRLRHWRAPTFIPVPRGRLPSRSSSSKLGFSHRVSCCITSARTRKIRCSDLHFKIDMLKELNAKLSEEGLQHIPNDLTTEEAKECLIAACQKFCVLCDFGRPARMLDKVLNGN
ncbi:hypothetical protein DM860_013265 [Cuscuta australis]|uniref:Uncharacterized protein n=1 Tax=Cuscuta australis TaxID=267555 RepID=A0A328DPW8_9ASTE|nr:hypothetical protein DM860_013265 [Cuscuta australis]